MKSSRMLSEAQEVSNTLSQIYFPLPFGPVQYEDKLDLIKRILRYEKEFDCNYRWNSLGYESPFYEAVDDEKQAIKQFVSQVFGNSHFDSSMNVFRICYKDMRLSKKEDWKKEETSPVKYHWTNVLARASAQFDNLNTINPAVS